VWEGKGVKRREGATEVEESTLIQASTLWIVNIERREERGD
jgi:hypothetical protein